MTISTELQVAIVISIAPSLVAVTALVKLFRKLDGRLTQWKEETKAASVAAVVAAYERGKKDQKTDTDWEKRHGTKS